MDLTVAETVNSDITKFGVKMVCYAVRKLWNGVARSEGLYQLLDKGWNKGCANFSTQNKNFIKKNQSLWKDSD